ncbi:acyl carrier protein, partial [Mycobacterium canetti]|uniref:acyl carrier protein n=1 Tax=Mycobacterium canetti TaxID=78331 RepID=UPI00059B21D1
SAFAQHSPFAEKFQSLGQNRSSTSKFLAELDELTQEEWPTRLRRLISEQVGLILRRTVDADRPLAEFGLDSLGNLELRTHIEAETKIRITTADITTIRGLADLLFDKLSSKADIAAPS